MHQVAPEDWKYYVAWVRAHQKDVYLLWQERTSGEALWTDESRRIPGFSSIEEVTAMAANLGVEIEEQAPLLHDFDQVLRWLDHTAKQVPCAVCLGAWNLFDDLASGVNDEFIGKRQGPVRNRVYHKLFWGSGTFGVDTQGQMRLSGESVAVKLWRPFWRPEERRTLRRVLRQGFRLWDKYVYAASNAPA